MSTSFNHSKPYSHEILNAKSSEENKNDTQAKKKEATIDETFYQRDYIKEMYNQVSVKDTPSRSTQFNMLKKMPLFMAHQIDFGKFDSQAVYDYANALASSNEVAGIENESFMK